MPAPFARVLGLIAAAMVVLAMLAPTPTTLQAAAWTALGVLGVLVATYPSSRPVGVRTDAKAAHAEPADALPREVRGSRARTAILSHMSERPGEAVALVASFMRKGITAASESPRDAAPAYLAQQVRELTDGRAIELAELLGLDLSRRWERSTEAA